MITALVVIAVFAIGAVAGNMWGSRATRESIIEELEDTRKPHYVSLLGYPILQEDELPANPSPRAKRASQTLDRVNEDYVDVLKPIYEYDDNGEPVGIPDTPAASKEEIDKLASDYDEYADHVTEEEFRAAFPELASWEATLESREWMKNYLEEAKARAQK